MPVQVAVLTAEIKHDIVRAARELLADPVHWMPGMGEDGKLAYAAREIEGRLVRVEVGSDDATRYSLMGAVLLELHRRNVTPTAGGRTEFLDQEIPASLWSAACGEEEPRGTDKAPDSTDERLMGASHAQCLAALDRLVQEYAATARGDAESPTVRALRGASVEELMVRAAKDEPISSTELLRAVYRELMGFNRRLAELEAAKTAAPTVPLPPSPAESRGA